MTGEMSKSEVTRKNCPIHFACAELFEGATVEPFDEYQGSYVHIPDRGRFFITISSDNDGVLAARWYGERKDTVSRPFTTLKNAIDEFLDLIGNGGEPNPAS